MYDCEMCGACCRNLKYSEIYAELDRGDGICKYLEDNKCQIYDERPIICRVDECYSLFFKGIMAKEDFYAENKRICKILREKGRD